MENVMPAVSTQLQDFLLPAPAAPADLAPSWWSRLGRSFIEARTRAAEREIARLIESRGGRMTDTLEREIERSFL